jgi:hypothetical protein
MNHYLNSKMNFTDRGPLFSFSRPDNKTFFDFQNAAIVHCVDAINNGKPAVLALDTGLGKTCTLREIIIRLKFKAIVIVPGGLVRQVAAALTHFPWKTDDSEIPLRVCTAETGKQVISVRAPHDIFVVNRALLIPQSVKSSYDLVVIDEAHQPSSMRAHCIYSSASVLFMTACPGESSELCDFFRRFAQRPGAASSGREFAEACFVVEKTPRVLEALGAAHPKLVLLHRDLPDPDKYDSEIIRYISSSYLSGGLGLPGRLHILLAYANLIPRAAAMAAQNLQLLMQNALSNNDELPKGEFVSRARILLSAHNLTFPENEGEEGRNINLDRGSRCACCRLTRAEYLHLHHAHSMAVPTYSPPWVLQRKGFTSCLIRFRSKAQIEETLKDFPVPDNILTFVLTSDKSAAYRANLIKKFAGHDGQRAKLAVLTRAIENGKAPEHILRVGALGFVMKEIEMFLARPRILLADSTVDVGFDLHRHIDGMHVPQMVATYAELRQLIGRISRIATEKSNQGSIDVLTNCTDNSLDEALFIKHITQEETVSSAGAPPLLLAQAASLRQKLSGEELCLFERLWAHAGRALYS